MKRCNRDSFHYLHWRGFQPSLESYTILEGRYWVHMLPVIWDGLSNSFYTYKWNFRCPRSIQGPIPQTPISPSTGYVLRVHGERTKDMHRGNNAKGFTFLTDICYWQSNNKVLKAKSLQIIYRVVSNPSQIGGFKSISNTKNPFQIQKYARKWEQIKDTSE